MSLNAGILSSPCILGSSSLRISALALWSFLVSAVGSPTKVLSIREASIHQGRFEEQILRMPKRHEITSLNLEPRILQ
jgi:hypothetical protein